MENAETKILVVEDENSIRKFILINLKREGYTVLEAESGEKAVEIIKNHRIDVMILDLMLPSMDGFDVCMKTREIDENMTIIMLTAKGEDLDKVMGLDLGADDYMVKPFNPMELLARIRAHLRKKNSINGRPTQFLQAGSIRYDIKSHQFNKDNKILDLTPTEFAIMQFLINNINSPISRDQLLNEIWGKNYFGDMKTIDVHIRRLREKIEDDPSNPKLIETVWGFGYKLRG